MTAVPLPPGGAAVRTAGKDLMVHEGAKGMRPFVLHKSPGGSGFEISPDKVPRLRM